MLKDKLGHIQNFKNLFGQKSVAEGRAKSEAVRATPPTGVPEKLTLQRKGGHKARMSSTGSSLKPSWSLVIG